MDKLILSFNQHVFNIDIKFELFIYSNKQNIKIENGKASILIYVKSSPIIIENSFQINPSCNKQFDYFYDIFIMTQDDITYSPSCIPWKLFMISYSV